METDGVRSCDISTDAQTLLPATLPSGRLLTISAREFSERTGLVTLSAPSEIIAALEGDTAQPLRSPSEANLTDSISIAAAHSGRRAVMN